MSFERRNKILSILMEKGAVSLKELEATFPEVSSMTLRRDLEFFEKTGEAVRVRGGVRYIQPFSGTRVEDVYSLRLAKNQAAKDSIARMAAEYIETGRSIYLDSGTTMMHLARVLPDTNLSILTSSPYIALEVSKLYAPTVTLIGGQMNRDSQSVSGAQSQAFVKNCNFDVAFMVSSAFSADTGFSCGNYNECELKRHIVSKAKLTILMVDASKFGRSMPFTFANFEDIDVLVTDQKPSEQVLEAAAKQHVQVRWE